MSRTRDWNLHGQSVCVQRHTFPHDLNWFLTFSTDCAKMSSADKKTFSTQNLDLWTELKSRAKCRSFARRIICAHTLTERSGSVLMQCPVSSMFRVHRPFRERGPFIWNPGSLKLEAQIQLVREICSANRTTTDGPSQSRRGSSVHCEFLVDPVSCAAGQTRHSCYPRGRPPSVWSETIGSSGEHTSVEPKFL